MHSTKNIKNSHYISILCCRRDIADRCVFNYCNWLDKKRGLLYLVEEPLVDTA